METGVGTPLELAVPAEVLRTTPPALPPEPLVAEAPPAPADTPCPVAEQLAKAKAERTTMAPPHSKRRFSTATSVEHKEGI
jgi:hypothetical protein